MPIKSFLSPALLVVLLPILVPQVYAEQGQGDLAFPGYSGYLNVPSASVLGHGVANLQWSDQAYLSGRDGFGDGRYGHLNNLSGAFGIFPKVEIGGRMTWDKTQRNCYEDGCTIRDLSANVKIQAPIIPEHWFTLAAGVQDLGGETGDFEAIYLVAGKQIGPLSLTAGYGRPEIATRYLDGAFGAISYRPLPWLNLMAEHDSRDLRFGVGVSTPAGFLPVGVQIKGKVIAWDDRDDTTRNFASLGLSVPFGNRASKPEQPREKVSDTITPFPIVSNDKAKAPQRAVVASPLSTGAGDRVDRSEPYMQKREAAVVGQQLVDAGYDSVRTAGNGTTLHVWWENNIFNRDERDSIASVASIVRGITDRFEYAELTLLNQGLPVLTRNVALTASKDSSPVTLSRQSLFTTDSPEWDFKGSYGPSWKPRLTISPAISSGVATEYGVWDASVAVKSELALNLWPGAVLGARYDLEIYQTEDFDEGGVFFDERQRTALVEAEIQQTFKLHAQFYTSVHLGRYDINYDGVLSETLLLSPGAHHSIRLLSGRFQHKDERDISRSQALAGYQYYNPALDAQFSVHGGKFFEEDTGFRVDSRFWFGDYALTLQYKNTDAEFVSLGWVIPLTPVKDRQWRYLQIKGDANWNYSVQSRINEDTNDLSFGGASILESSNPLQELYLNRGRIGR